MYLSSGRDITTEEIRDVLKDFAKFCKNNGGSSWHSIPEEGIEWYLSKFPLTIKI